MQGSFGFGSDASIIGVCIRVHHTSNHGCLIAMLASEQGAGLSTACELIHCPAELRTKRGDLPLTAEL